VSGGFDTRFSFQVTGQSGGGADGFTFIIHNDSRGTSLLADHGGGLGYSGFPTAAAGVGALNSLVVEFDTWTQQSSGGFPTGEFAGSNEISVHTSRTYKDDSTVDSILTPPLDGIDKCGSARNPFLFFFLLRMCVSHSFHGCPSSAHCRRCAFFASIRRSLAFSPDAWPV